MSLDRYHIFAAVAETRNISQAAVRLHLSQPAVSQAIAALERSLGTTLFARTTRRLTLTPDGELLRRHVDPALRLLSAAENEIASRRELRSGEIRLGAADTVCKYLLMPVLREFSRRYPQVRIHLVNRTSRVLAELARSNALDLAFAGRQTGHADGLHHRPFTRFSEVFVASPERFAACCTHTLTPSGLSGHPLLLLPQDTATRTELDAWFAASGVTPSAVLELESVDLLVELARAGSGIAHVMRESALQYVHSGELCILETTKKLPERELDVIWSDRVPLTPAAAAFLEVVRTLAVSESVRMVNGENL